MSPKGTRRRSKLAPSVILRPRSKLAPSVILRPRSGRRISLLRKRRDSSVAINKTKDSLSKSSLLIGILGDVPKWTKGGVCKTPIQRFKSARRLQHSNLSPTSQGAGGGFIFLAFWLPARGQVLVKKLG